MNEILFFGSSFIAGLLSFLSPCVFPLIPSYLSFISGTSLKELEAEQTARKKAFINTLFFVIGFTLIFIVLQIIAIATFNVIVKVINIINPIAGTIIILFGLNFIFDFIKILNIEKRFNIKKMQSGILGPLIFGMAFGAGWTPCIGPFLLTILMTAGASGNYFFGIILMIIYSFGLGLPFLIIGLFFSFFNKQLNKIKPYIGKIKVFSGIFLIMIGIFIIIGGLSNFNIMLFQAAQNLKAFDNSNPLLLKLIVSAVFLMSFILILFYYIKFIIASKPDNKIRPVRISLLAVLLLMFALSITGVISISDIFISWIGLNI